MALSGGVGVVGSPRARADSSKFFVEIRAPASLPCDVAAHIGRGDRSPSAHVIMLEPTERMDPLDDARIEPRRFRTGGRLFFLSTFTGTTAPYRFEMGGSGTVQEDPNFLFALPEYGQAFGVVFGDAIERLADSKSPVLQELVTRAPGERVRTQRVTGPNGEAIDVEPRLTALPYRFGADDVTRFDLRSFARACDETAEVLADATLDHLLSATGRIAEGLGQVGHAGGQQFGWPVLMAGLEQVEIEFSPDGEPILPRIVAEHDKRHFVEYPPLTDADRPAFDQLMARKRQQFNARPGRR